MIAMGTLVFSNKIHGHVVGIGILKWPPTKNQHGDSTEQFVYLVQVAEGSSSLGQACVVMRADQIVEL
jgi:hypothetical protein